MMDGQHEVPVKRHPFVTGFVALFPLVLTLFVLSFLWKVVSTLSDPVGSAINEIVRRVAPNAQLPRFTGDVAALLLVALVIYLMGLAISRVFGPRLVQWTDSVFLRMPIIRYIYPHAKTLADFLFGTRKLSFSRVVLIEYPRKGVWQIGFITSNSFQDANRQTGKKLVTVFVPTSPTPFTGWTALFEENDVVYLTIPVEEAVRFVVSCGVIPPGMDATNLAAPTPHSAAPPAPVPGTPMPKIVVRPDDPGRV